MGVCRSGSSPSMKSMNSGTPASVALPERSSFGMIRSTSTRTVSHSWGVNCFGSYGVPRASASRARAEASRSDSAVHGNAAASGAAAISPTTSRRFMSATPDLVAGAGSPSGSGRLTAAPPSPLRLRLRDCPLPRLGRGLAASPGPRGAPGGEDARGGRGRPSAPDVRTISQRTLFHLIGDVLAGAHRQRENRPRRVLVRLRHKGRAVGEEEVLAVVRLAPAVRHGRLRVVPHAGPAQLVDDGAACGDAVPPLGPRHRREHLTPHVGDQRPEGLLHVLHLLVLVIRPLPVKPEDRNPPPIHHAWVDLAVAVLVGDHLAAAREADRRAVVAPVVVLQLLAVAAAGGVAMNPAQEVVG